MRFFRSCDPRGSIQLFTLVLVAGAVFLPGTARAELPPGDLDSCLAQILPRDSLAPLPRVGQCTEGFFHPDGLIHPDDPTFFRTVQSGIPFLTDFVEPFTGGVAPIVPPNVGLREHYSAATTYAHVDSISEHTSNSVVIENRGSVHLAPPANPAATAGAQWGSHTSVELIPFRLDGASVDFPVSIEAEFTGSFFGTGGNRRELNSHLSYTMTIQARSAQTGQLSERAKVFGIVGFDGVGTVIADGNIADWDVTIESDGTGFAQGQFRPINLEFRPDIEDSLIVTTSFVGFGSYASDVSLALADGSETGIARIGSPDSQVRFRHSPDLLELIPGDTAPLDGVVNIDDLNRVRNSFGSGAGSDTSGIPGDTFPFDGFVNVDDLNAVRNHFGVGALAVPEPGSALLGLLGSMTCLVAGRRKRHVKR